MHGTKRLIAGDSLSFETTVSAYPADQGWTLKYRLVPRFTSPVQAPITLTATTYQVSGYQVQVAPGTTALWVPGVYEWTSFVERTGERITLETQQELTVQPDPATSAQGTDTRTENAIALANIRAMRLGATSKNVRSYTIGTRSLEHFDPDELKVLEQEYALKVKREENAARMAMGLKSNRKTFGRVARA